MSNVSVYVHLGFFNSDHNKLFFFHFDLEGTNNDLFDIFFFFSVSDYIFFFSVSDYICIKSKTGFVDPIQ